MSSIEGSLSKISDTLMIPLEYSGGNVKGSMNGKIRTPLGFDLPVSVKALKLFYSDQCGVLFHISGDLYMVVSHYPKLGGVCAFLIDGTKLRLGGKIMSPDLFIEKRMTLKAVITALKPGLVQAFHLSGNKWSVLRLTSFV